MNNKLFEFKKQRSFDDIIENSFKFFRDHIKPILKIFWENNQAVTIGLFISYFFYNYYAYQFLGVLLGKQTEKSTINPLLIDFIDIAFAIFAIVFSVRFFLTVIGYIVSYINNEGEIKEKEILKFVHKKFWTFIGATLILILIVVVIIIISSLIFALLIAILGSNGVKISILLAIPPIIYFFTFLNLYYQVLLLDNVTPGEAISLTRKYLKGKFWFSFLVIFVLGIIIWLIGMIFKVPVIIYTFIKGVAAADNPDVLIDMLQGDLFISAMALVSLAGQTVLNVLSLIGSAILYFSLKEYHTNQGLLEKLEKLDNSNHEQER